MRMFAHLCVGSGGTRCGWYPVCSVCGVRLLFIAYSRPLCYKPVLTRALQVPLHHTRLPFHIPGTITGSRPMPPLYGTASP
jgi:hypothetical protein